jgi:hypothetical protein
LVDEAIKGLQRNMEVALRAYEPIPEKDPDAGFSKEEWFFDTMAAQAMLGMRPESGGGD